MWWCQVTNKCKTPAGLSDKTICTNVASSQGWAGWLFHPMRTFYWRKMTNLRSENLSSSILVPSQGQGLSRVWSRIYNRDWTGQPQDNLCVYLTWFIISEWGRDIVPAPFRLPSIKAKKQMCGHSTPSLLGLMIMRRHMLDNLDYQNIQHFLNSSFSVFFLGLSFLYVLCVQLYTFIIQFGMNDWTYVLT